MIKVIFTAAIVFSVGILSLIKTTTTVDANKVTTVKLAKVLVGNKGILATAD